MTVESCDDTTPTTTTAFRYRKQTTPDTFGAWTDATATGFTTTAGADQVYEVLVDAEDLSGTDKYVCLQLTEDTDSPCDGAVVCILFGPRYGKGVPDSVLT